MEAYVTISIWLLTTLVPNLVIAWKEGGWYWRGTGQYAGNKPAAAVWFAWILVANLFLYPLIEKAIIWIYDALKMENSLPVFVIIVGFWVYFFIYENRGKRAQLS